jgi:hypothetical protein
MLKAGAIFMLFAPLGGQLYLIFFIESLSVSTTLHEAHLGRAKEESP